MAYIGAEPVPGQNREVDDISSGFNGNATAFTLQVNSLNVSPESANNILINLGGVLQNPGTDYTVAASTLTFTTAPASGLSFFGLILGAGINTATVADGTISTAKIVDQAVDLTKLPHGTGSNDGKFLRANNGADPSFETVGGDFGSQNIVTTGSISGAAGTFTGDVTIPDTIVHTGDSDTKMRFPAANVISFETAGADRLAIGTNEVVVNDPGNSIDFRVEGDTNANLLFVDASTDAVGIGTSSPLTDAQLTISAADAPALAFQRSGSGKFETAIAISSGHFFFKAGADSSTVAGLNDIMKIESTGNVGIGVTSVQERLHVANNGNCNITSQCTASGSGANAAVQVKSADGGDYLIQTGNAVSGGLRVYDGTANATRMTVTSSGNVEIANLCVAGAGLTQVDNAQSLISQSSTGGSSTTYFIGNAAIQVSSDRRIKENIVDTSLDAITELNKVRVVDFTWNDPNDKAINNRNSRGKWTGCIAQEIVNVFPFAVNAPRPEGKEIDHDSEALWGMEYGQLVPVLIKGFQELQAKITTLESEVAALKAS